MKEAGDQKGKREGKTTAKEEKQNLHPKMRNVNVVSRARAT